MPPIVAACVGIAAQEPAQAHLVIPLGNANRGVCVRRRIGGTEAFRQS
jgi:hypothetical protein